VALGTLAVGAALPTAAGLAARGPRVSGAIAAVAAACLAASCAQTWLYHSPQAARWREDVRHMGAWPEVVGSYFFITGVVLLLRWGASGGAASKEPSLLSALSRLSAGINVSNLFVLNYAGLYLLDEPLELNAFTFLGVLAATTMISTALSLVMFLLVQGPCEALVGAGSTSKRQCS